MNLDNRFDAFGFVCPKTLGHGGDHVLDVVKFACHNNFCSKLTVLRIKVLNFQHKEKGFLTPCVKFSRRYHKSPQTFFGETP